MQSRELSQKYLVNSVAGGPVRETKPFIVDSDSAMLKRNDELSKNARRLWGAMRAIADGTTGEVRKNDKWFSPEAIDRAAEMCKCVRMPAMRELLETGYVTFVRPRVLRFIGHRQRMVLGCIRYTVYRRPVAPANRTLGKGAEKHPIKSRVLLRSISSTVEKTDQQDLPNPPITAHPHSPVADFAAPLNEQSGDRSSSPTANSTADDDSALQPSFESKTNKHRDAARSRLLKEGEPAQLIDERFSMFEGRASRPPTSEEFYLTAYRNEDIASEIRLNREAQTRIEANVGAGIEIVRDYSLPLKSDRLAPIERKTADPPAKQLALPPMPEAVSRTPDVPSPAECADLIRKSLGGLAKQKDLLKGENHVAAVAEGGTYGTGTQ